MNMLDENMRGALNQLIDMTTVSFHTAMSSLRTDKVDLHIQNESDYAIGLAHDYRYAIDSARNSTG
jgi:hypothetical protein